VSRDTRIDLMRGYAMLAIALRVKHPFGEP
jgi:hypothetical protein